MLKHHMAACLMVTALAAAPAIAQVSTAPAGSPPANAPATAPSTGTGMQGTTTAPAGTMAPAPRAPGAGMTTAAPATAGSDITFLTVREQGVYRASDLMDKVVYGANNERIGEVEDVLIDRDGRIIAIVVGVGGFLGIGEKDVAVPMTALQMGPGMADTTATGTVTTVPGTASGTAPRTATNGQVGRDGLPDRLVLMTTKEQLQAAPKFVDDDRAGTGAPATGARPGTGAAPAAPRQ